MFQGRSIQLKLQISRNAFLIKNLTQINKCRSSSYFGEVYRRGNFIKGTTKKTARARFKKYVDVVPTEELIKRSKSATEWFKNVIYDKEAIPSYLYKPMRVRFILNPYKVMQIDDLRIALFNYLFAKKNNGAFILRIDDIDKPHGVENGENNAVEMLKWVGLSWDEGLASKYEDLSQNKSSGPCSPYYQSQRLNIYNKWIHTLLENHQAYHCFCTPERLHDLRKKNKPAKGEIFKYDRACLGLSDKEINEKLESGAPYSIRMLVPGGETSFQDMIHGKITVDNKKIDDQILIRSDGNPTNHFSNIVDDYTMGISHVIRGAEWLQSTSKHMILYKMFDIDPPSFAHIPQLIHNSGAKLSKYGDLSVEKFKNEGYMPQAIVNGLALFGWTPPSHEDPQAIGGSVREFMETEVLELEDLEAYFNILKIGKSNCKFDEEKLKYYNSQHLRRSFIYYNMNERRESTTRFRQLLFDHLPEEVHSEIRKYNYLKIAKIMDIVIPRINFYSDIINYIYFFKDPEFTSKEAQASWKKVIKDSNQAKTILSDLYDALSKLDDKFLKEEVHKVLSVYLYEKVQSGINLNNEDVYILLRFIVSARRTGPEVGAICEILGKLSTLKRISDMINVISDIE